jgi:hypothetical protein
MSETKAMCEVCGHKHRIVPACRRCGFDGACKGCMRLHNAECPRSGLPDRNSPELASYAGALDAMQASALRALDDADTCADTASIDAQCAVDQPAAWQADLRDGVNHLLDAATHLRYAAMQLERMQRLTHLYGALLVLLNEETDD